MSYILDALRKAEQERHLGQAPHPVTAQPPTGPAAQRRWLWLAIGLGLSSNAALLGYLLLRPQPPTATPQSISVPATGSTPSAPPPVAGPAPAPIASISLTPAAPLTRPPAAEPPTPSNATLAPMVEPGPVISPPTPRPSPTTPPPRKAVKPSSPAESVAAPPVASRTEQQSALAKVAPPSITIGPEPPPLVDELPAHSRRGLPTSLDIHVYSPDARKRFVVLNGQRFKEGESIGQGVVLEAVTPGGATLRQGEQRFRLLILR